jgi:hypothetical protein
VDGKWRLSLYDPNLTQGRVHRVQAGTEAVLLSHESGREDSHAVRSVSGLQPYDLKLLEHPNGTSHLLVAGCDKSKGAGRLG